MCNHYRLNPEQIPTWREYISADPLGGEWSEKNLDIWPRKLAVIARREGERTMLDAMIWGVPRTMQGKRPGTTVTKHITNVRNLTSPFWKSMLARPERRCLVPFSEFAEPKIGQARAEWWFTIREAPVACFAGIWRPSEAGHVFAFLTCEPNPLVAPLHPKAMPVVLHPDDYQTWLTTDFDGACAPAQPLPSQMMAVA